MEISDVVMRLTGPVCPVGETNEDAQRLANLKQLTETVDALLFQISTIAAFANRPEDSMRRIGVHARDFLRSVREQT